MKLTLKTKLIILIFIPLIISFILITIVYNNHINNHFNQMAQQETTHKLKVFEDRLQNLKQSLENFTKRVLVDEDILASLNLIVNYEDKNDYKYLIFDAEKRKLLKHYNTFTTNAYRFSISYYNLNKELLAYTQIGKNYQESIITSYDKKGNPIYLDGDNEIVTLPAHIIKLNYSQSSYYVKNNILHIQILTPVLKENEIIAHLKTVLKVDQNSFSQLSSDIGENFYLVAPNTVFSHDGSSPKISYEQLHSSDKKTISTQNMFYSFEPICKNKQEQNTYSLAGYDKELLNSDLQKIIYQVTAILGAFYLGVLLLIKLFTDRYILEPLKNLLTSIKSLKEKNFTAIEIEGNDELAQISKSFNELSMELQSSVVSLEKSNILLQNILDTVPMRIFIKDIDGRYIKANLAFLQDCGFKDEEEILGKTDADLPWQQDEKEHFSEDDKKVINTDTPVLRKEEFQTRANNRKAFIVTSKIALKNKENKVIGLLGIYDDITEQKEVKQQLQEKEKYLLHQSRLAQMGEMISMIAHQWRQPLAAISSTANSLSLKVAMDKYEEQYFEERLHNINTYSQHLSATIDDFRNFFKKHKDKKEVTLEQLIDDSLNIITTSMQNRLIEVHKDYNCFKIFQTYPNELRQVILNLLKNAEDALVDLKSKEKWVKISTEYKNGKHIFSIQDSGGGIDEDVIDKIFEPYFSTKKNKDGTGLGLYMSKTIIEDHCNGKISAYNSKFGAVFKVEL